MFDECRGRFPRGIAAHCESERNCGRLSEIGGQRMDAERKLVATETSQDETTTNTENGGAAMMRQAADLVLRDKCMDIAFALADSSIDGHIQSTKFLYDLADEKQKLGSIEIAERFHSVALDLTNELRLSGKLKLEAAQTAVRDLEPRGQH